MMVKLISELVFGTSFKLKTSLGNADGSPDTYEGTASRVKHAWMDRQVTGRLKRTHFEWLAEPDRPKVPRPHINSPGR
jgi:hypothetical protein